MCEGDWRLSVQSKRFCTVKSLAESDVQHFIGNYVLILCFDGEAGCVIRPWLVDLTVRNDVAALMEARQNSRGC